MFSILLISSLLYPFIVPIIIVLNGKFKVSTIGISIIAGIGLATISLGLKNTGALSGDLVAYSETSMQMGNGSLADAFTLAAQEKYQDYYLAVIWLWLVGRYANTCLIPALGAFIEYAVLTYMLVDYSKHKDWNYDKLLISVISFICLVAYYFSVSSVRSTPALSISMLALYLDYVRNKRYPWIPLLYIIPCFIHVAGILAIAFRVALILFNKHPKLAFFVMGGSLVAAYRTAILLDPIATSIGLGNLSTKIVRYVNWTSTGWAGVVSSSRYYKVLKYTNILTCVVLASIIFVAQSIQKNQDNIDETDERLITLSLCGIGFTLGIAAIITVPSYLRFTYIFYPPSILICVEYLDKVDVRYLDRRRSPNIHTSKYASLLTNLSLVVVCVTQLMLHLYSLLIHVDKALLVKYLLLGLPSLLL